MRRVLVIAIFVFLAMNAFAQSGYDYMYSEPTKSVYFDLSLGAFMPTGTHREGNIIDIDYTNGLNFGFDLNIYLNKNFGLNVMFTSMFYETEKLQNIYLDITQAAIGAGIAFRHEISQNAEFFANAGLAYSAVGYDVINNGITNASAQSPDGAIAAYIDAGVRFFPSDSFYILIRGKYFASGDAKSVDYLGNEINMGMSGFILAAGVGMAF